MGAKKARKRTRSTRTAMVSLVSMPFKDLRHPPIQLGILQRCLERAGISASSHSLELAFMEHLHARSAAAGGQLLTTADYQEIATQAFLAHLGDWVFMTPPYAEPSAEHEQSFLAVARAAGVRESAIEVAQRMKALVPEFLERASDEILAEDPRIVGFSSVFQQNVASLSLAKVLKGRNPSLTIVFGGGNCDGPMGKALHQSFPWVDAVVRGEGEKVLVELAGDVLARRPIRPQPGLCYRDGSSPVACPLAGGPQVPMDEVPTPTYDEFFERLAQSPLRTELWPDVAILFEASRGCWWGEKHHCTFCGLNGELMKFRSKPAARVADEILAFAARYKVLDFVAVDDIIDLRHIRELLPLLAAKRCDLSIFFETKANLTKDQVRAFKNAGVSAIQPGIESLSTPILRLMRKGVTGFQNIRLLKWCAELGIKPAWNLLYGFPGEPQEEYARMAKLIPALVHLDPPSILPIDLERFSPYFDHPAEFGIEIIGPCPEFPLLYPVSSETLHDLAYDFTFRHLDGRDPDVYTADVREAVRKWQESAASAVGSLIHRRGPGFVLVQDRRPGLESADYLFEGVEAAIYLACDGGATPQEIAAALRAEGESDIDDQEIAGYLEELVEARLVYGEQNRFLALAIALNASSGMSNARSNADDGMLSAVC
jgi:ribosomal peptide maturation radical SAM protein 1